MKLVTVCTLLGFALSSLQAAALGKFDGDCMGVFTPESPSLPSCEKHTKAVKHSRGMHDGAYWPVEVVWRLAAQRTVNKRKYQVWLDTSTGLLWSDKLEKNYIHDCVGEECHHPDPRYSYAMEMDRDDHLINDFACSSQDGENARAGMTSKKFGIPTKSETNQAIIDGIRFILPNIHAYFWTSTIAPDRKFTWTFNGFNMWTGSDAIDDSENSRTSLDSVICVGR